MKFNYDSMSANRRRCQCHCHTACCTLPTASANRFYEECWNYCGHSMFAEAFSRFHLIANSFFFFIFLSKIKIYYSRVNNRLKSLILFVCVCVYVNARSCECVCGCLYVRSMSKYARILIADNYFARSHSPSYNTVYCVQCSAFAWMLCSSPYPIHIYTLCMERDRYPVSIQLRTNCSGTQTHHKRMHSKILWADNYPIK